MRLGLPADKTYCILPTFHFARDYVNGGFAANLRGHHHNMTASFEMQDRDRLTEIV